MPIGDGVQVHAGFIDTNGKITPNAKKEFIRQVIEEIKKGTPTGPGTFSCGIVLPPNPDFDLDLEDETLFPDFHKTAFKNYENIAQTLNVQGNFSILPICDPMALGAQINGPEWSKKVSLDLKGGEFLTFALGDLPALVNKLEFKNPIELGAKFPSIIKAPKIPKIPTPEELGLPDPRQFPELYVTLSAPLKLPEAVMKLAEKAPNLAVKIATADLAGVFKEACQLVNGEGKPISPPATVDKTSPSNSAINIAVANVTSRMATAMTVAAAMGSVIGSASSGVTGGIGVEAKVKQPSDLIINQSSIRDRIVEKALQAISDAAGGSAGKTNLSFFANPSEYAQFLLFTECGSGEDLSILPKSDPRYDSRVIGTKKAVQLPSLKFSSCGMTARACYSYAGASIYLSGDLLQTEILGALGAVINNARLSEKEKQQQSAGLRPSLPKVVDGVEYYKNYFTDAYLGYDVGFLFRLATRLGVLKYQGSPHRGGPGLEYVKKGDLIFVGNTTQKDTSAPVHVAVAISDWDGNSLQTVEGGQPILKNGKHAREYRNPRGDENDWSTIRRFKWYDTNYTGEKASDARTDEENHLGSWRPIQFKDGRPHTFGWAAGGTIMGVLDAEMFIKNQEFKDPKNPAKISSFRINSLDSDISTQELEGMFV